jgi:hypothetical protein
MHFSTFHMEGGNCSLRNGKSKIKRQSNCSRLQDIIGAENPILVVANKADLLMNIQTDKVWASTAILVVWAMLGAWSRREGLRQNGVFRDNVRMKRRATGCVCSTALAR